MVNPTERPPNLSVAIPSPAQDVLRLPEPTLPLSERFFRGYAAVIAMLVFSGVALAIPWLGVGGLLVTLVLVLRARKAMQPKALRKKGSVVHMGKVAVPCGEGHVLLEKRANKSATWFVTSHSLAGTLAISKTMYEGRAIAESVARFGRFPFHWKGQHGVEVRPPHELDTPIVERWKRHPELVAPIEQSQDPLVSRRADGVVVVRSAPTSTLHALLATCVAVGGLVLGIYLFKELPRGRKGNIGEFVVMLDVFIAIPWAAIVWVTRHLTTDYQVSAEGIAHYINGKMTWSHPWTAFESMSASKHSVVLAGDHSQVSLGVSGLGSNARLGAILQHAVLGASQDPTGLLEEGAEKPLQRAAAAAPTRSTVTR